MRENKESISVEPLTLLEKSIFFNRMLGVWFVGVLMFAFLTFLFFFTKGSDEFNEPSFLWLFPLLFYGVLGYIIFTHTKNAFQKNKTVYKGIITEKMVKASKVNSASSVRQTFKICLGDTWFDVENAIYAKVKVGNEVKLNCLDRNIAFSAEVLNAADEEILQAMESYLKSKQVNKATFSLLDLVAFNYEDRKLVKKKLLRTIFFRSIIGLGLMVSIYFIAFLFFVILIRSENVLLLQAFVYLLLLILAIIYFLINRKTWKLLRDVLDAQKYTVEEEIIDKVSSTNKKPAPNSIVVVNGNTLNHTRYFYLQTPSFWLPVSELEYQIAKVDAVLKISLAKNSKTILGLDFGNNERTN